MSTLFHSSLKQRCVGSTVLGNAIGYFEFSVIDGNSCLVHSHANSQACSQAFLFSQQPVVIICSCPSAAVLLSSPSLLYFGGGDQTEIQEYVNKHFSTELPCNPSPMALILPNICIYPLLLFSFLKYLGEHNIFILLFILIDKSRITESHAIGRW